MKQMSVRQYQNKPLKNVKLIQLTVNSSVYSGCIFKFSELIFWACFVVCSLASLTTFYSLNPPRINEPSCLNCD